ERNGEARRCRLRVDAPSATRAAVCSPASAISFSKDLRCCKFSAASVLPFSLQILVRAVVQVGSGNPVHGRTNSSRRRKTLSANENDVRVAPTGNGQPVTGNWLPATGNYSYR